MKFFKKLNKKYTYKGIALLWTILAMVFAVMICSVLYAISSQNTHLALLQERQLDAYLASISGFELAYGALIKERPEIVIDGNTGHLYQVYAGEDTSHLPSALPAVIEDAGFIFDPDGDGVGPVVKLKLIKGPLKTGSSVGAVTKVIIESSAVFEYEFGGKQREAANKIVVEIDPTNPSVYDINSKFGY